MAEEELFRRGICPHCGNLSKHEVRWKHTFEPLAADGRPFGENYAYLGAVCSSCEDLVLYGGWAEVSWEYVMAESIVQFPRSVELEGVPASVKEHYEKARRVMLMPDLYATQIRRALEAVCRDRRAEGMKLDAKLADLARKEDLPQELMAATRFVQKMGNLGAHDSDREVEGVHVGPLDEFFRALIDHLYVMPARLKRLEDQISKLDAAHATGVSN